MDKIRATLSGPVTNNLQLPGANFPEGNDTGGFLRYRARLGWAGGSGFLDGVSITGFMNFIPHSANFAEISSTYVPPNCFWAPGFQAGSCYPGSPYWGPYTVFPNSAPGQYTFDLSLGYQTGIKPA